MINDFVIYNKVMNYYSYVLQYVSNNISSVHRNIRVHFLDEIYNLIRLIYMAAYNKGNIRMKYLSDLQVSISMVDMLSHLLLELCPDNKNHIIKSISFLTQIKNMVYSWKKNEEKDK